MFDVQWDPDNNGVLLDDNIVDKNIINPPRPVFFEELDILGLNKSWTYPRTTSPLLWAIGRKYYYKGIEVAEAKGGNFYQAPNIIINNNSYNLCLESINLKKIIEKNKQALFLLENEAMDFVDYTYRKFRDKIDFFAAAYSGGKDSQVVLDIVTRVLNPKDFIVIFSDTKMEIPFTYDIVKETKAAYNHKYPDIKFYTATPPMDTLEYWKLFGPPSRIHRWCCTVIKTAPFAKLIKDIYKSKYTMSHRQPKILVYEGVRSDESFKRSFYSRIANGVKHINIINARLVLFWNSVEVFLYLFSRRITLNKGYRFGLSRVGCAVCPFASGWSEFILYNINKEMSDNYISIINSNINALGLHKENDKVKYFLDGQWKKRAGGRGINTNGVSLNFIILDDTMKAVIRNPRENFLEWLKTLGDIFYKKQGNIIIGEVKIKNNIYPFNLTIKKERIIIEFKNLFNNVLVQNKLKKVLYKSAYCVHCNACSVECPTGSITFNPNLNIKSCSHCYNCLYFQSKGCLVAKSIDNAHGGYEHMKAKKTGIDRYSTFGIRDEWLKSFFSYGNKWLESNNLGNKQVMAVLHWLSDADILNIKNKNITQLGNNLSKLYLINSLFAWSILWNNVYYNSPIITWYINTIEWGMTFIKKELKDKVSISYPEYSKGTISNAVDAMLNMFAFSPLGDKMKIGIQEHKGRTVNVIKKIGTDEIEPLIIAYSLYKAAENTNRRDFTISELYRKEFVGGPYKIFGISQDKLKKILRGLQEYKNQILKVDLVADLDNISLREDLTSLNIVEILLKSNE